MFGGLNCTLNECFEVRYTTSTFFMIPQHGRNRYGGIVIEGGTTLQTFIDARLWQALLTREQGDLLMHAL